MAKTFLFIRGPKTERRLNLVLNLRRDLPRTTWISMDEVDREDPKRAHAGCITLTEQALLRPDIDLIAVDNESLLPIHWQAYYARAQRMSIAVLTIGIDVFSDDPEQENLQLANSSLFIRTTDKYWCVKTDLDAIEVEAWFKSMKGSDDAVVSGAA